MGCHSLLQGIFLTQGLNPSLLHYRQILYCPNHQSIRIAWYNLYFRKTLATVLSKAKVENQSGGHWIRRSERCCCLHQHGDSVSGEKWLDSECILKGKILKFIHRLAIAHERKVIKTLKVAECGTSLVVQWMRICLPAKGTWGPSLVQEDSTCGGGNKPMPHNYWALTLESVSCNYQACVLQLRKPTCLEPVLHNAE